MNTIDIAQRIKHIEATQQNSCKVPTRPYSFLNQRKENGIFYLSNSPLHNQVMSKFKTRLHDSLVYNEKSLESTLIHNLDKISLYDNDLLNFDRLNLIDETFELAIEKFKQTRDILAAIKREYKQNIDIKISNRKERVFLMSRIQALSGITGDKQMVINLRKKNRELVTNLEKAKSMKLDNKRKSMESEIKFLRLVGGLYDKEIAKELDQDKINDLANKGRWTFIIEHLEKGDNDLFGLLAKIKSNPENYRCFFIGIDQMDFDQITDSLLISKKQKIEDFKSLLQQGISETKLVDKSIKELEKLVEAKRDKAAEMTVVIDSLKLRLERLSKDL